jgi:hypothetical protein
MLLIEWFATSAENVGIAAFDFYSLGHIAMGVGIFLFFSLFYTIPMRGKGNSRVLLPLWAVWIITVACGILWEWVENSLFIDLGIKFEGRHDSLINIITDIIFVGIGGLGMWYLAHLIFEKGKFIFFYYIIGITGFLLWISIFIVLRSATLT